MPVCVCVCVYVSQMQISHLLLRSGGRPFRDRLFGGAGFVPDIGRFHTAHTHTHTHTWTSATRFYHLSHARWLVMQDVTSCTAL